MRRDAGGEREQADLRRRVEAEPEEHAERVHLPAASIVPAERLEKKRLMKPCLEALLESLLVELPLLHAEEHADDVEQHEQVEDPIDERKMPETHAPIAAVSLQRRDRREPTDFAATASPAVRQKTTRVPEREEEADAERALAVLQELPRRVVDRRDVVGVERVPKAEGVRERPEPREAGIVRR